jgi:hypothetical protein
MRFFWQELKWTALSVSQPEPGSIFRLHGTRSLFGRQLVLYIAAHPVAIIDANLNIPIGFLFAHQRFRSLCSPTHSEHTLSGAITVSHWQDMRWSSSPAIPPIPYFRKANYFPNRSFIPRTHMVLLRDAATIMYSFDDAKNMLVLFTMQSRDPNL